VEVGAHSKQHNLTIVQRKDKIQFPTVIFGFSSVMAKDDLTPVGLLYVAAHVPAEQSPFSLILTSNAQVIMQWIDPALRWNSTEYGGITEISVTKDQIWTPDIILYNA
jgi:hypothetical protein